MQHITLQHQMLTPQLYYRISYSALVIIAIAFFAYLFLISNTIMNISDRKTAEQTIRERTTELAQLEEKYIALSSNITLDEARLLGFVEIDRVAFVQTNNVTSVALGSR